MDGVMEQERARWEQSAKEIREAKERKAEEKVLQKKTGKRGELKRDAVLKALEEYERFQKRAFEAMWMQKLSAGTMPSELIHRRAELTTELGYLANEEDGVRKRRLLAELWAIDRITGRKV